jgi:hypothetical protein
MKVSLQRTRALCRLRGVAMGEVLRDAGVSRNAFYTLARRESVVPRSLRAIAMHLDVPVGALLEETSTPGERVRAVTAETERLVQRNAALDADNIRHTLLLLDEAPMDRLRRALRRGRRFDFR